MRSGQRIEWLVAISGRSVARCAITDIIEDIILEHRTGDAGQPIHVVIAKVSGLCRFGDLQDLIRGAVLILPVKQGARRSGVSQPREPTHVIEQIARRNPVRICSCLRQIISIIAESYSCAVGSILHRRSANLSRTQAMQDYFAPKSESVQHRRVRYGPEQDENWKP